MKKIFLILAIAAGVLTGNAQCNKDAATPIKHAIQLSGNIGTNRNAPKEIGIAGVWKQNVAPNLFLNGGLDFNFALSNSKGNVDKRNLFEIGIPLQVEWGKLCHCKGGLYGIFGLQPTVYTTISPKDVVLTRATQYQRTGFMISPSLEFGGNVPVGKVIMRIGVYGAYKVNCGSGDKINPYAEAGKMMFGAKIGVVL